MPTTPLTATQVCVDPGFAAGEPSAEVRRPVHAPTQPRTQQATAPAHQASTSVGWWGDAWALWNRHPQGGPQAADTRADNLGLNHH